MPIRLLPVLVLLALTLPAHAELRNVALASDGALIASSSDYGAQAAPIAIDGKWNGPGDPADANRWHSALGRPHPHWLWIRFRQPAEISKFVVRRADLLGYPVDFRVEYEPVGGGAMRTLFSVKDNKMTADLWVFERSFEPVVADGVRLWISRSSNEQYTNWSQISEMEVFGEYVGGARKEPNVKAPVDKLPQPQLKPTAHEGLTVTKGPDEIEFRSKWLRIVASRKSARVNALCWDSLGEGKVDANLLKPGPNGGARFGLTPIFSNGSEQEDVRVDTNGNVIRYTLSLPGGIAARWEIRVGAKAIRIATSWVAAQKALVRLRPSVQFAFDVSKTPVAPLTNPIPGSTAPMPCLLHASDYGTLLVKSSSRTGGQIEGESIRWLAQWNANLIDNAPRGEDGLFALAPGKSGLDLTLSVESAMPLAKLIGPDTRLRGLPRHWLNMFQYRPDIGILSNNIVSDNCVFCMFTYTDFAAFTPTLPGGVEAMSMCRESMDRYLAGAPGYGVGWEDIETETYPCLLISAWDIIRVTGDMKALKKWLPKLESFAAKMQAQDRDGNGLPESTKPGTSGEVHCPSSNWWDQINFGHEDAYACALAFRGYKCLADLEKLAGNAAESAHYAEKAEQVKASYLPTFYNPQTGILAGWKDAEGKLHDYWFVFVNAVAITYDLVPQALANKIVDKIEAKMQEVGYNRFDLGLPGNLVPIPKNDYGLGALGSPQKDDGTDAFGIFENGGATACYAYYYINALYKLGRTAEADRILWPMIKTYADGGYQNGVGNGGEWRHWDGRPSGYEGMLTDAYLTQLSVLTGYHGIGFGPEGFYLQPWSPLKGKTTPLGLKYMGKVVKEIR